MASLNEIYNTRFGGGYIGLPNPLLRADKARVKGRAAVAVDSTARVAAAEQMLLMETAMPGRQPELLSYLGTPIMMPIALLAPGETEVSAASWLPNEPLITVSSTNNIVKAARTGARGTFKEFMGLGDYEIRIQGIAIDEGRPDDYPEEMVARLRRLAEYGQHLQVICPLMRVFGIHYLVIESANFPPEQGGIAYQQYEFSCCSDEEIVLEIREDFKRV